MGFRFGELGADSYTWTSTGSVENLVFFELGVGCGWLADEWGCGVPVEERRAEGSGEVGREWCWGVWIAMSVYPEEGGVWIS